MKRDAEMIDGRYKIKVDVPFGRKDGTIALRTEGEAVIADIDAPIVGKQHVEGRAEGDAFTAQGSGRISLVGRVDYTLKGEVVGDGLRIDIQSSKGAFKLEGTRV